MVLVVPSTPWAGTARKSGRLVATFLASLTWVSSLHEWHSFKTKPHLIFPRSRRWKSNGEGNYIAAGNMCDDFIHLFNEELLIIYCLSSTVICIIDARLRNGPAFKRLYSLINLFKITYLLLISCAKNNCGIPSLAEKTEQTEQSRK